MHKYLLLTILKILFVVLKFVELHQFLFLRIPFFDRSRRMLNLRHCHHNGFEWPDTFHINKHCKLSAGYNLGLGITTLSITTLSIMTLSITTLSIMALSITAFSTMTLCITTLHYMLQQWSHNAECHYAECRDGWKSRRRVGLCLVSIQHRLLKSQYKLVE